jgi:hypothetical protein
MRYTQIPENAFKEIQLNAGCLCTSFTPGDGTLTGIIGASTGGWNFTATPTFSDWGDDIDNCPKNMKELKKLESWEIKMSGTFVTITAAAAKALVGAADIASADSTKIVPRNDIKDSDFADLWWVGDYSDQNGEKNGGFIAIHMMNTLSTGGFQIKSSDKAKGNFAAEFTAHYSMENQDEVPFEVYVKAGTGET